MGNFISNLIARHTTAASYVMPRLRGRFESQPGPAAETRPVYARGNVSPSADDPAAAAGALPERPNAAGTPPHEPHMQERDDKPSVPPANSTVAPPETLLSLFTPSSAGPPAADPLPGSGGEQPLAGNYPDPIPMGGTVNNLFVNHPLTENSETDTPFTQPEQEPHAAARPLYFTISPPGQGLAFNLNNGNGSTISPQWFNHFSPDRNMQRSGQYSVAASAPQPVIKVSIGRIDVRAITQPAAAKNNTAAKPAMSLDDFLKKRSGGTS